MRVVPSWWWDLWNAGGPYVGDNKPCSRVTVDASQIASDYQFLHMSPSGQNIGSYSRVPIRWFQRCDNSQLETELPNIKSVNIDRSIDNDAATCEIVLYNQKMLPLTGVPSNELGQPGFFTFGRGTSDDEVARWQNHEPNSWYNVLTPNTLLRTYQGFGGNDKTLPDAITDGNIILSGVWLIDTVSVSTSGTITLKCRDMGKLLVDQVCYPPLVPATGYPVERCRWTQRTTAVNKDGPVSIRQIGKEEGLAKYGHYPSGNYYWFSNGVSHGHAVEHAFDGNPGSYWLSVGNVTAQVPFAVEWIEFALDGQNLNKIMVWPFLGNYRMYVSVFKDGNWLPGAGPIAYDPQGIGRYDPYIHIPYVFTTGVPFETAQWWCLPELYQGVDKVRLTFDNLQYDGQDGLTYRYIAALREMGAGVHESYSITEKVDGNFKDYSDIIKDILLWAGFWCYDPDFGLDPEVYGNIETTGVPGNDPNFECLPMEWFDRKPLIDIIRQIRDIVGYHFWVDDEGGARFEAPNIWRWPINFTEDGAQTTFTPVIDERHQLISYGVAISDKPIYTDVIFSNIDVYNRLNDQSDPLAVTAQFRNPMGDAVMKGMVHQLYYGLPNDVPIKKEEAETGAMLAAVRGFMASRQGQVDCMGNPAIQINDQVRIFERQTSETYIHYVRGVQTRHDLDTGDYRMTLTTHWMGDETQGVLLPNNLDPYLQRYFERINSRATNIARLGNYFTHPTTIYAPTGEQPPVDP